MIYTKRFLFLLATLLIPVTVLLAQEPVTTEEPAPPAQQPTAIPVIGSTPLNAQPGLPESMATLESLPTAQPAAPNVTPQPTQAGGTAPQTPATNNTLALPASSSDACPALVLESYNATLATCPSVASGEVCLGNGVVEASPRVENPNFNFSLSGDKTTYTELSELRLRTIDIDSRAWTVVKAQIALSSSDVSAPPQNTALVMVGDVVVANDGQQVGAGARLATVLATSGINVRRSPATSGVVVWQLSPGEQVTVTGRTADNQWIRIEIPSRFGGVGWVYSPYLDVDGGAETLRFVTANSERPDLSPPEFGPMQAINLLSGITAPDCVDTPDSGILLQSPSGLPIEQAVKIQINDVLVQVNGTIFIQSQSGGSLTVSVLEGSASLTAGGSTATASTGSSLSVALNDQLTPQGAPVSGSVDMAKMVTLPVNLLPREFGLVAAEGEQPPVANTTTDTGSTTAPETTINTAPIEPTAAPVCTLTAVDTTRNIRVTPSTNSAVVGVLRPGESIQAIGAVRDADGLVYIWYETQRGFMRFDTVQVTDSCSALTGIPPAGSDTGAPPVAAPTEGVEVVAVDTQPTNGSLISADFGELCGTDVISRSFNFPDGTNAVSIGSLWTAAAGTTANFGVSGGIVFKSEFGDYIRLVDESNNIIARSGENLKLDFTFEQAATFQFQVIASKGDFVIVTAGCNQ